jgi:hypothetical protein
VVRIADIKIGERVRQNMGDLDELAKSIAKVSLLQFPVVGPGLDLIAGERRIRACQQLGWTELPVHIAESLDDVAAQLRAEQDENRCRENLTHSEREAVARKLSIAMAPAAAQRKAATQFQPGGRRLVRRPSSADKDGVDIGDKSPGRHGPGKVTPHRARDEVADVLGTSERTLRKTKVVVDACSDPDPEVRRVAIQAREEMDRTGKVDAAYRKVVEAKEQRSTKPRPGRQTRLSNRRRGQSSVIQLSSERDVKNLCDRTHQALGRLHQQLDQSSDGVAISPELSSSLDDLIDVAQDCRRYGED